MRKHSRRRHPKRHVFLKGMIIYSVLMLVVIAALICVGWKYASLRDDALPERAIEKMISRGDATYWKQLLLNELPKTYPAYEDGERLAREVLADRFSVGEVTYIKFTSRNTKDRTCFSAHFRRQAYGRSDSAQSARQAFRTWRMGDRLGEQSASRTLNPRASISASTPSRYSKAPFSA